MAPTSRSATLLLLAGLLAAAPASASVERARAAQARGDLRAAQIELRNAARDNPNAGDIRAALAAASLDLGDGDTAEKEARAAMERGYDKAAGTSLLVRSYLVTGRFQNLLRDVPEPEADAAPAVAAQVAAGRAMAQLGLNQQAEARRSVETALRLAPGAAEPNLAASALAGAAGDRAAAEAAVDRALAADAENAEALLRKGSLQFERGDYQAASETFGRLIARAPGNVQARLRRGEARLRLDDLAGAGADVDSALRSNPNSPPAIYLSAVLLGRAGKWAEANEALQRIEPLLTNFPDGLLLQAGVKRALGQREQAEDAARRHFARRPEDPRGAKLLASLEMEANRPDAAAGTLSRLVARGAADAEALDMLGRAHMEAGRPREAAEALARAAELAPGNAAILSRLAAARLAAGDTARMATAAQEALRASPDARGTRQMLAIAALSRGDVAAAEAELDRLTPEARGGEAAQVLEGTIRLIRLDLPGARTAFETALRGNPDSVPARLGLARLSAMDGRIEEAERLLGEVLRRDPDNAEALGRLSTAALSGGPRAAPSQAVLEAAQAAAPADPTLALVTANVLIRRGEPGRAAALLDAEPLRANRTGPAIPLLLAEARAGQNQWAEAEAATRVALAADPASSVARRQLALLVNRRGDMRGAETLLDEGLRTKPGDPVLQGAVIALAQQAGGLEAALAAADRLAARPGSMPAASVLRGDLLLNARRPEDAARAYAAAYQQAPSAVLAQRAAAAWQAAGRAGDAAAALNAWLAREPNNPVVLATLARLDMAAGRDAEAERRLATVVEQAPQDAASLNDLAWLTQKRGGAEALARARVLAERAYFIAPSVEVADTLGWIRFRSGDAAAAVPLLRAAASAAGQSAAAPGISYRLAAALRATGQRDEALRMLEPLLAGGAAFPERADAERLLAELRAGR